ncbi:MAG: ATP-dependent metallopeptidase FtsH/Yme1/Tma family protein [Parcubacteria group bacterium]|nr:ATP-dependent metallopeptidase FtsH/Yme1/Tma family protein [Parcubacteria group bacterium]
MKKFAKYILYLVLFFILMSAFVAIFDLSTEKPTNISLSELVKNINSGDVKEIAISENNLKIVFNDGAVKHSKKEPDVGLSQTLVSLSVKPEQLEKINLNIEEASGFKALLLNVGPIIIPFVLTILIFWFLFRSAQKGAMQTFQFGKTKAKLANTSGTNGKRVTFQDVAGLKETKEEIQEVVEFLKDPKKFEKVGARIPRGVLLIGPPGTGKTLLAKAVANEAGVPFFYVSGAEFVELFVGIGSSRVKDTFITAKQNSPSIIFIDEIDAIGRHRGAGLGGGHDEREQTLNQILIELDGFDTSDAVIVLAGTNRPDILDPALLRPGRFDRKVILDMPSLSDRQEMLKIHTLDKPLANDVNIKPIAERTPGFSGADIANLVNEAAILAARKNQSEIKQTDFLTAIEKVMLGPERKSHAFNDKEKEIAAYHEAGHALVSASLPNTDPVHKISVVSRGKAGGYTLKLPSEDKHLRSKKEFESELAVLLGGYAAEKVIFKDITTGASNDLQIASELARKMVTEYGMSEKLGPTTYGEKDEMVFLGKELSTAKNYSENVALEIDKEIKNFIDKALKTAKIIITQKLNIIHKIATVLKEKETIEQAEFYSLLKA